MTSTAYTDTCPRGLPRGKRTSKKVQNPPTFNSREQMASKGTKRPRDVTATASSDGQGVHLEKKSKTAETRPDAAKSFPVLPIVMYLPCREYHDVDPAGLVKAFQLSLRAPVAVTTDGRECINMSCAPIQCPHCPTTDPQNRFLAPDLSGLTVAMPQVLRMWKADEKSATCQLCLEFKGTIREVSEHLGAENSDGTRVCQGWTVKCPCCHVKIRLGKVFHADQEAHSTRCGQLAYNNAVDLIAVKLKSICGERGSAVEIAARNKLIEAAHALTIERVPNLNFLAMAQGFCELATSEIPLPTSTFREIMPSQPLYQSAEFKQELDVADNLAATKKPPMFLARQAIIMPAPLSMMTTTQGGGGEGSFVPLPPATGTTPQGPFASSPSSSSSSDEETDMEGTVGQPDYGVRAPDPPSDLLAKMFNNNSAVSQSSGCSTPMVNMDSLNGPDYIV